jgi:putative membrane protein
MAGRALDTGHAHLHWHTEPGLLVGLVRLWRHRDSLAKQRMIYGRATSFVLALLVLYGAIASPLDAIGEAYLFSAHMVQHMILIYVVPVLFLLGLPVCRLRHVMTFRGAKFICRWLTHPIIACLLFNLNFAVWHIPALYEWSLRDRAVHILEHGMFMGTGVLMWWPLLSRLPEYPRLLPGLQVLYVLGLALGQIPVFAYVTFAAEVLYPTYETAARLVPLTPLEDQQLGGIIMKAVSMGALFAMLTLAFWRWYQTEQIQPMTQRDGETAFEFP